MILYHVQFDDGTFLYGDGAHPYHAYYFFDEWTARHAANGLIASLRDQYGAETLDGMTFTVESADYDPPLFWAKLKGLYDRMETR
jgi:hypothetical protein